MAYSALSSWRVKREQDVEGDGYGMEAFQMIRTNLFRTIVRIIQDVCANHPLLKEGSR